MPAATNRMLVLCSPNVIKRRVGLSSIMNVFFITEEMTMRPVLYSAVAASAFLAVSAVKAAAISAPTFSLEYPVFPGVSGGISLVSTSQASSVIALNQFEEVLHVKNEQTSAADLISTGSTLQLTAAEGYRITGVAFSATVQGSLTPAVVPPNAVDVDYGDVRNSAWADVGIVAPGATPVSRKLYYQTHVTAPITVGGTVLNDTGLRSFDLLLDVWASASADRTYFSVPYPDGVTGPEGEPTWEGRAWGIAELQYLNPTLTVYTEVVPVPEPGQWAMLAGGLLILGSARLRRSLR